jgi:hypothetical protein
MTGVSLRPGSEKVMLLCLDALALAADCDLPAPSPGSDWPARAAQLLRHARTHGWDVAHVVSRRPRPGETAWRPMAGLAPEPSEAVYHREDVSAFSSPHLRAALTEGPRREVVLCGVSVRGSGLATALDALRLALRLTVADDAVFLQPAERAGLDGLLLIQRTGLTHSRVRVASTEALIGPWRRLRLVQGGRA